MVGEVKLFCSDGQFQHPVPVGVFVTVSLCSTGGILAMQSYQTEVALLFGQSVASC